MLNAPFCPIKQKLRRNESEVSMVKIPQHKVTKMVIFLLTLLLVFFWQSDHRFLHSRGAVLWLGQNQNIMLDNFEIFQKVMAFQKMNTSKQAFSKFLSRIAQKKLKKNWVHYKIEFYSFALWSSDCNLTRSFLSKVVLSGRMDI